eukprot:14102532-Heterocapsa_arctica.AAC.1
MSGYKCLGNAIHPNHQPCAGKYTRLTEEHTWNMTDLVTQRGEVQRLQWIKVWRHWKLRSSET